MPVVEVLVPVVGRPQAALPFMASLAGDDRVRVLAIVEDEDAASWAAWAAAGAVVVAGSARTFAEKVNMGFRFTHADWVLLAGDDVRFTAGWLDACLKVAATGASVVGTSETVNRRVKSGTHSCHPFIQRDYIVEVGASWDGPGVVCHEGYRHWYVDDEIVAAAKQRKVWAFAAEAVLEHLHPVHGLADMDAVYRAGQSRKENDRQLFQQRRLQFGGPL
jgi:hypothetical protein